MSDDGYDPTRHPQAPELPKRRPFAAHDAELDEANRLGIRPATDAEAGIRFRVLKRRR